MKQPPFCPNPGCVLHREDLPITDWFTYKGRYSSKHKAGIQRFKCRVCGKKFSTQSFHIDYYAKKQVDYESLIRYMCEGLSLRATQRISGLSRNTIQNRIDRLSRYCTAKTLKILRKLRVKEHLAADGFESFVKSQYVPINIHILVGAQSQFLYFFNHVALRRKGRMTEGQKTHRQELYKTCRFAKHRLKHVFGEVVHHVEQMIIHRGLTPIRLYTDEKKEYGYALAETVREYGAKQDIAQVVISSTRKRTTRNRLFPVNYMDREFRKDQAAFRRESTCFARNTNNCLSRLNVYAAYHNFSKRFRLNGEGRRFTHAEAAGIPQEQSRSFWSDLDMGRGFRKLSFLWGFLDNLWLKSVPTPYKENHYVPHYAYV
jgi:transposase-like protein